MPTTFLKLLLAGMLALPAALAGTLWTIGGDGLGVPRQLVPIDPVAQTVGAPLALGTGATGFAGGLAWNGAGFYGLESDGLGSTNLVSITTGGSITSLFPVGAFGYGGLSFLGPELYGIRTGSLGDPELVQFDLVNQTLNLVTVTGLPQGQYGGLSNGPAANRLYTLHNDGFGASSLYEIDLALGTAAVQPITLGSGFYGGLAYSGGQFYALASDLNALGTLYQFAPGDSAPAAQFAPGYGFLNAALTAGEQPSPAEAPEPATALPALAALGLLAFRGRQGDGRR
jgi:hypothetical protein